MNNLEKVCRICELGDFEQEPKIVTGGLLHKMYCVETNQGKYAIKVLNSNVMNKPDALEKLEQAERIAYRLKNENDISAICVKSVAGKSRRAIRKNPCFKYLRGGIVSGKYSAL